MEALKSPCSSGVILSCLLVSAVSCGSISRPEKWIVPENYTGWLRLDYAINGTPPLPIESGAYVVRMPQSGRLQTSSRFSSSIDQNEFFMATAYGLRRLDFSQGRLAKSQPAIEGYSVQSAFGFFKLISGNIQNPGKCVFVGTRYAFNDNGRDCQKWEHGQSEPPKFYAAPAHNE